MNNLSKSVPSFEPEQKEIIRFQNKVKFFQHVRKFKDTFEKIKFEKIPEKKRIEKLKILKSAQLMLYNDEILEGFSIMYSKNKGIKFCLDLLINVFIKKFSAYT